MKVDETKIELDTSRVITWQYDHSETLMSFFGVIDSLSSATFTDFFNNFLNYIMTIENIGTSGDPFEGYGLAIWGIVTGLKRPTVTINGTTRPISDNNYKKILIARLHQMYRPATLASIEQFMQDVFGNGVYITENPNGNPMTVSFIINGEIEDEELNALASDSTNIIKILELPIGVGLDTPTRPTGQFGLNFSETEGQNMENFAVDQSDGYGGSLA